MQGEKSLRLAAVWQKCLKLKAALFCSTPVHLRVFLQLHEAANLIDHIIINVRPMR